MCVVQSQITEDEGIAVTGPQVMGTLTSSNSLQQT